MERPSGIWHIYRQFPKNFNSVGKNGYVIKFFFFTGKMQETRAAFTSPAASSQQPVAGLVLASASGRSTPDTPDIWSKIWSDLEYFIGVL
jgi:hypothetical protein